MGSETRQLELTIDVDSDPISGSVSNGAHGPRRFTGWIELVAAIEVARSSGTPAGSSGETCAETLGYIPGANARGGVVSYPPLHDPDEATSEDRGRVGMDRGGVDPSWGHK